MQSLDRIVEYANRYLRISEIGDWDNALNGLQVQNSGRIKKIGAAVDVSTRVLSKAAKQGVDLLIVHHGLLWPGLQPITGMLHRQLTIAFRSDIALYSAHLPLDVHPIVGNNAQLAASVGLKSLKPFLEEKGQPVGLKKSVSLSREQLVGRLTRSLDGPVKSFNFGPKKTRVVGIITGAAGSEIPRGSREYRDLYHRRSSPLGSCCR